MSFKTEHAEVAFDGDCFNFSVNISYCGYGKRYYDMIACFKVINGEVVDIDSGEMFEDVIFDFFREVGWEHFPDMVESYDNYVKYFKVFEQYIIDNRGYMPTGRFTKPAMH
jgi:hypothetical protein